jgi:hypothetical protein
MQASPRKQQALLWALMYLAHPKIIEPWNQTSSGESTPGIILRGLRSSGGDGKLQAMIGIMTTVRVVGPNSPSGTLPKSSTRVTLPPTSMKTVLATIGFANSASLI